jgi:hypothetical protein
MVFAFYNIFLNEEDNLNLGLKLLKVPTVPESSLQRYRTLWKIAKQISFRFNTVAVPFSSKFDSLIAVPSDCDIVTPFTIETDYRRDITYDKDIKIDFSNGYHRRILKDFLHETARKNLWNNKDLWSSSAIEFLTNTPVRTIKSVDIYQGFCFRYEILKNKIALILDVKTSFLDSRSVLDYKKSGEYEALKNKVMVSEDRESKFVLDYGKRKYKVYFDSVLDKKTSEFEFRDNKGQIYTVYNYIIEKYLWLKNTLNKDNLVALIRYYPDSPSTAPCDSSLLKLVLNTQQISEDVFRFCILEPEERERKILNFMKRYLYEAKFGKLTIKFSDKFLSSDEIEGKRFMLPTLMFGNNGRVSTDIKEKNAKFIKFENWKYAKKTGLSEFGPYKKVELRNPLLLYPEDIKEDTVKKFKEDILKIASGIQEFPDFKILPYKDPMTITKYINDNAESNFSFIILPSKNSEEYDIFRKELCDTGTQCVNKETIFPSGYDEISGEFKKRQESRYNNILFTMISGIIGKSKGLPWILSEELNYDCYIGVDIGGALTGIASYSYVFDKQGKYLGTDKGEAQKGEEINESKFKWAIIKAIMKFKENNRQPLGSIVIHRDGKLQDEERKGLEKSIEYLLKNNFIDENTKIAVAQIKKSYHPYRIFNKVSGNKTENPVIGDYLLINEKMALITTSGRPIITQGTAIPLLVELEEIKGKFDLEKILKDILFLSELNWGSPLIPIKLPITIKYAEDIASLVSRGIEPTTLPL